MSGAPLVLQGKPINEALRPIQWLIGRWRAENGSGHFPTIHPFSYCEEIEFFSMGQPVLNYAAYSWHPQKKTAMHLESGFLRIQPGTQNLALLIAHNFGLTTVEEGHVRDNTIELVTKDITRMSFAKDPEVTKICRSWALSNSNTLEQVLQMETSKTALTEHLRVVYSKVE